MAERKKMYCVSICNGQTFWLVIGDEALANLREDLASFQLSYTVKEMDNGQRNRCIEFLQST